MNDEDLNKLRGVIKEEIETAIKPLGERMERVEDKLERVEVKLERVEDKLERVEVKLERVEDKLDALTGDVMDLQEQTKAIWDKISIGDDRNKREINEIKTHLGMPLMSDIP